MWKHPDTVDIILGIVIGVILLVFGYRLARARAKEQDRDAMASVTPARVFMMAASTARPTAPTHSTTDNIGRDSLCS